MWGGGRLTPAQAEFQAPSGGGRAGQAAFWTMVRIPAPGVRPKHEHDGGARNKKKLDGGACWQISPSNMMGWGGAPPGQTSAEPHS
eukprot:gene14413-biopygen8099